MRDLSFTPKTYGRKEKAKAALYTAVAVVAFVCGMLPVAGKGLLQLVFVVFVSLDIMHCIKYFLTSYTYTLTEECGDVMIIVTQTQGKRISTLANLRVADIKSIQLMSSNEALESIQKKYGSSCVKYNYAFGDGREKTIVITVKNDYTRYIIMLTYDDVFYTALSQIHKSVEEFGEDEE